MQVQEVCGIISLVRRDYTGRLLLASIVFWNGPGVGSTGAFSFNCSVFRLSEKIP